MHTMIIFAANAATSSFIDISTTQQKRFRQDFSLQTKGISKGSPFMELLLVSHICVIITI